MARSSRYKVKFRRRREGKTDYYARREMIKSNKLRLVVRKSNRYITAQLVRATPIGDETIVSGSTRELRELGWRGGTKNTPAAYLLGLLLGLRALRLGIKEAILDVGLHRPTRGSRIFAVLKGVLDAGLRVPHGEGVLPSEDRLVGKHIAEYSSGLSEEELKRRFSGYLTRGLNPGDLPKHFEEIKARITTS